MVRALRQSQGVGAAERVEEDGILSHVVGERSSGQLSRRDALVCTLRAGKIEKGTYYNDQQQALKAVGLEE